VGVVVVRGTSMRPTLADGDRLLVRWGSPARLGALAVVRLPDGRPLGVKRLALRDPGGWWVERDNAAEGVDSWQLGHPIPDADVLGLVLLRIWPRPGPLPGSPERGGR
jgi:hypothetical protein